MKKVISVAILIVLLIPLETLPANAIFGFSRCEKAKNAITKEEVIGLSLWKDFHRYRKGVVSKGNVSIAEYYEATIKLEPVLESDLKIWRVVETNQQCFKASDSAYFRTQKSEAVRYLEAIRSYFKSYLELTISQRKGPEDRNAYNFLRNYYLSYGDIVTGKILAK
jgi:hypothetical protein